jgi:hypothetical protein
MLKSSSWGGDVSPHLSEEKAMYLVLKRFRALGVTYEPGTTAEFQHETAKNLLAIGRIEEITENPVAEELIEEKQTRVVKTRKTRTKKAK